MEQNGQEKNYSHFSNIKCEYYPCHQDADPECFSCLFCYCPLYMLGDKCGGSFSYTQQGVKDCSACLIPHTWGGYDYVVSRLQEVMEPTKKDGRQNGGKNEKKE